VHKLSYKTLLTVVVFLLIGIVVLLKLSSIKKVSAAWWNDSWNYRVAVNIGNTGGSLTNFQVPINIGTSALINSGKMQSDCDDIRIIDQNGNLLNYWISGCNTNSTQIWPKIPSIPNGGINLYVYYGNSSATSVKINIGTSDSPGLSCKSINDAGDSSGNNNYWIDPTNGDDSDKFQAYCDMTNDSGGWMLVTQSMINSEIGSSVTPTKTTSVNNGVDFSIMNNHSGCGGSIYYRVLFNDIIPWTKIKADYEFLGGHSCWSIFGNTGYSAGTNLIPFSLATDIIRNQVKMGGSNGDNYDGINSRCDNKTFNFWHSNQGTGTTRSAQVILRRNSMASLAGIGTGVGCDVINYPWKYQNIYIREDTMTFPTNSLVSSEEAGGGPIAYWKFDEGVGTTAYDSTSNKINGNIGTGNSAPTWVNEDMCISGKCLNFGGDGDSFNTSSFANTFTGLTVETWIKSNTTAIGSYSRIISTNSWNPGFIMAVTDTNKFRVYLWDDAEDSQTGTTNINDNKWHHIAFTINTVDGKFYLYVDGKQEIYKVSTITTPIITTGKTIGFANDREFNGFLDEPKIYPYARTPAQIKLDYNSRGSSKGSSVNLGVQSTNPTLNSKLIAHYKFDEGYGTTTSDYSPQKKTGTFTGTTLPTWSNNCEQGKCINFTNTNLNKISTNVIYDNLSEYTITGSFYPTTDGGSQWRIITGTAKGNNIDAGIVLSGLNLCYHDYITSSGTNFCSSNSPVVLNKWQHFALSFKENDVNIYLNGIKIKNISVGKTNNSSIALIGGASSDYSSGARFFNGSIDEVKIYNTALTEEEIKLDYNQGSSISFGTTNQTIGGTTTSLDYCIPGDTSLCNSPIAQWKMDEKTGSTINDDSGNNNIGTFGTGSSAPTWVQGKIGSALNFDGSKQYISINDNSTLKPNTSITVESWFNPANKTATGQRIVSKTEGSGYQLSLNETSVCGSTNLCFTLNLSGTYYTATYPVSNLSNNVWYHVAGTYDGNTVKLFLNGSSVGTTSTIVNSINQSTVPLCIGSEPSATVCNNQGGNFSGKIDQVRIYNYARTPAQIAYDYNKGAPVGWWKFDECQGNTVYDWSGNNNNGTISVGAGGSQNSLGTCQSGTSAAWTNGASGKFNSSLNFDGTDDYIYTNSNTTLKLQSNTFSMWINAVDLNAYRGLLEIVSASTGSRYGRIMSFGSNEIRYHIGYDNFNNSYVSFPNVPLNKWVHLVGTWDGATMKSYIDGVKVGEFSFNSVIPYDGNVLLKIGLDPGRYFNGKIDDIRIYNYPLTPEQIKTVYNNGAVNFN